MVMMWIMMMKTPIKMIMKIKIKMTLQIQVIAAEGEQKASRALKEAADVIQESPQALQVF